jgi:hypothetical protein
MPKLSRRTALAVFAALALPRSGAAAQINPDWGATPLRLMMVTEPACLFCRAWRAEIGPGFANSTIGRAAPLFEVDLNGPYPDGLALARRPRLTPSFILLHKGAEVGRIEGYVGQQHFYPVVEQMMLQAGFDSTGKGI